MNRDQKAAVVDEIAGQIEAASAIFEGRVVGTEGERWVQVVMQPALVRIVKSGEKPLKARIAPTDPAC